MPSYHLIYGFKILHFFILDQKKIKINIGQQQGFFMGRFDKFAVLYGLTGRVKIWTLIVLIKLHMGVKYQYLYIKYSNYFLTARNTYFKLCTLNTISWPVSCSIQESNILSWTSACLHKYTPRLLSPIKYQHKFELL